VAESKTCGKNSRGIYTAGRQDTAIAKKALIEYFDPPSQYVNIDINEFKYKNS